MTHRLHDLLSPEPERTPAEGLREALALHDEGLAIERLRLVREGVPEQEIDGRIHAWLAEHPPPGAGESSFVWRRLSR